MTQEILSTNHDNPSLSQSREKRFGEEPLTVSAATDLVKQAIQRGLPKSLQVIGEISNFKRHSSGHLYLTLKDQFSELSCIMWRFTAESLKFEPTNGLEVIATGSIEVFERAGRYQLYIRRLEPRGVGALELAFRQLCERLDKEGFFDARHKRPLPYLPQRIGVVTSETGAAIADILRTLRRRCPYTEVLIYPVAVQGPSAAGQIAHAIGVLNERREKLGGVDLLIVGRGGGSLEDLWAFNEEPVVRAIFASVIPIISAVGHEVDLTVADLVADVRAATPTAAAELAVPLLEELLADLDRHRRRISRALNHALELRSTQFHSLLRRTPFVGPQMMILRKEQIVDEVEVRLNQRLNFRLRAYRRRLEHVEPLLRHITPHKFYTRMSRVLFSVQRRFDRAIYIKINAALRRLERCQHRLESNSPVHEVQARMQRLNQLARELPRAILNRLSLASGRLDGQGQRLRAMGYKNVLQRGYSITRRKRRKQRERETLVIRNPQELRDGDRVIIELAGGEFESEVVNLHQLALFDRDDSQ